MAPTPMNAAWRTVRYFFSADDGSPAGDDGSAASVVSIGYASSVDDGAHRPTGRHPAGGDSCVQTQSKRSSTARSRACNRDATPSFW